MSFGSLTIPGRNAIEECDSCYQGDLQGNTPDELVNSLMPFSRASTKLGVIERAIRAYKITLVPMKKATLVTSASI